MFCRKCGKEIPDDSAFCGKCGEKVDISVFQSALKPTANTDTVDDKISVVKHDFISKDMKNNGNSSDNATSSDESENASGTFQQNNVKGGTVVLEDTSNPKKPPLRSLGVITTIIATVFLIWGGVVRGGSSRGFYNYPDYIYHMYGEYSWGIFLQTLGIALIGIYVSVCIIVMLYNKKLPDSIIIMVLTSLSCFIAAICNLTASDNEYIREVKTEAYRRGISITDDSDAIRLYYSDQKIFGTVFLIAGIVITVVFAISLVLYLFNKRNSEQPISEISDKKARTTRHILTVTKVAVSIMTVALMFIMRFNLREFDYTRINGRWYISHYYGSETALQIPAEHSGGEVGGIAQNAFESSDITSIRIPSNSRNSFDIRQNAFNNCPKLENITFSHNLYEVNVGAYAFKDCINLLEIEFGGKIYNLENGYKLSGIKKTNQPNQSRNPSQNDYLEKSDSKLAFEETQEAIMLQGFKCDKTAFTNCPRFTGVE